MTTDLLPESIRRDYEVREWKHACAILCHDFPEEWANIVDVLSCFKLRKSAIVAPGGQKSPIARVLDNEFFKRGWIKKKFKTEVVVDEDRHPNPTHEIDCFKNQVALEIEWNNKDPFYDRDLNNFRILFEMRAISAGVIITRCDELQSIFDDLGKGDSYGASTTHMSKLIPRVDGGGAGGCPVLVFGITSSLYVGGK